MKRVLVRFANTFPTHAFYENVSSFSMRMGARERDDALILHNRFNDDCVVLFGVQTFIVEDQHGA